jgi:hypothetical protein
MFMSLSRSGRCVSQVAKVQGRMLVSLKRLAYPAGLLSMWGGK